MADLNLDNLDELDDDSFESLIDYLEEGMGDEEYIAMFGEEPDGDS